MLDKGVFRGVDHVLHEGLVEMAGVAVQIFFAPRQHLRKGDG